MLLFAATRPYPGETANGDAWVSFKTERGWRVALIDGAGHGAAAAAASGLAKSSILASSVLSCGETLRLCHTAIHDSRGAVISIVEVREAEIEFAGVGNVEGRLFTDGSSVALPPSRGLLGYTMPTIRPVIFPIEKPWVAVLFTDGVSQRFLASFDYALAMRTPEAYIETILKEWGRVTDDATLVLLTSDA